MLPANVTVPASQQTSLLPAFIKGVNVAYYNYGADFGGITPWAKNSISQDPTWWWNAFADMSAHDIELARLWVFAELWTDAITYNSNKVPISMSSLVLNDVDKIPEIADNYDIELQLTLFSFDAFTTESDGPPNQVNISEIVRDATRLQGLIDVVAKPIAQRINQSANRSAVMAFDLCNEPEWIIKEPNSNDPSVPFEPHNGFYHGQVQNGFADPVSHNELKVFFRHLMKTLREEAPSIAITVGQAFVKWKSAFTDLDLDYYEFHFYSWMQSLEPEFRYQAPLPFTDKPVLIGEFPLQGATGGTVTQMLSTWNANGYFGALAWDYRPVNPTLAQRNQGLDSILAFNDPVPTNVTPPTEPPVNPPTEPPTINPGEPSTGAALPGILARGTFEVDGNGNQISNTSGSMVEIRDDGPILFANFFNSGAINPEANREYFLQLARLPQVNGCTPIRITADVGKPPANFNNRVFTVKGYPEIIPAGTKYGVPGETVGSNQSSYSSSSTGINYTDMSRTISLTSFPAFANDIPHISMRIDIDEFGIDPGTERDVMIESWFHDTKNDQTPTSDNLYGSLNNVIGDISEAGNIINVGGLNRRKHNNILLEMMVHIGPIGANEPGHYDAAEGVQKPASHYAATIDLGGWRWEIWFGDNSYSPLVVYNRIGPAGCNGSGCFTDLTNEGALDVPYEQILQHAIAANGLEQALSGANGQSQSKGAWIASNNVLYPFAKMREQNRTAISGIEVGLEPYYNGPNDTVFGMTVNALDLVVDGRQLGTCSVSESGCSLTVQYLPGGSASACRLPVTFLPGGCHLPVDYLEQDLQLYDIADCLSCPSPIQQIQLTVPYGQVLVLSPDRLFEFPANTDITINEARLSGGLTGTITNTGSQVTYTAPAIDTTCDVECGQLNLSYSYQCPGQSRVSPCSLDIRICTFPDNEELDDETIVVPTGEYPVIAAGYDSTGGINANQEILEEPHVGGLFWTGLGWEYRYPEGFVGVVDMVVPSSTTGDKARGGYRCVTVCVTTDKKFEIRDSACSVLAVKDKFTGKYEPYAQIRNASLSIEAYGEEEETDFETGDLVITDPVGLRWTSSLTIELLLGNNPLPVGRDAELQLLVDARFADGPKFYGTGRVRSFNTASGDANAKTATLNVTGTGSFYTTSWSV